MYHIRESRTLLTSDAKELVDILVNAFRQKKKDCDAAAAQLSLASLHIQPYPTPQNNRTAGQNSFQASPAPQNSQYPGLDYLLAPPTTNRPTLTSARSLNDLRNPNYVVQRAGEQVLRQQQQQLYMVQRVAESQARLAAQVTINRASMRGAEAIYDAIW